MIAGPPPPWRVYLALGRVSNLPTIWTNCMAGAALSFGALPAGRVAWVAAATSFFYTAGMYLNDAFDAGYDRTARPERPIPRGLVMPRRVFVIGALLLAGGELLLVWAPARAYDQPPVLAGVLGLVLAGVILYYSWRHKRDPLSALVMALCRALVYLIAAASLTDRLGPWVLGGAAILFIYGLILSQLAKHDVVQGRTIARLIAGISLLDAVMVFVGTAEWPLAVGTMAGFPLTLALQRVAPGT